MSGPIYDLPWKIPLTGRADLARGIAAYGLEGLVEMARSSELEMKAVPKKPKSKPKARAGSASVGFSRTGDESDLPDLPEEPFWIAANAQSKAYDPDRAVPEWFFEKSPFIPGELIAPSQPEKPTFQELVPWSRLWPFLRQTLGEWRPTNRIDLAALTKKLVEGQVPHRIPALTRRGWTRRCQVILDFSFRLRPFWEDMRALIPRLCHMRGAFGLELWILREGIRGPWLLKVGDKEIESEYAYPEAGTPVLAFGDLGALLSNENERRAWATLGETFGRIGCRARALTPCRLSRHDTRILRWWEPIEWDRGIRLPLADSAPESSSAQPDPKQADWGMDKWVEKLLTLLSPAVVIEPGLLRAMRFLLPADDAKAELEAMVWNHPSTYACRVALSLRAEAMIAYREKWVSSTFDPIRDSALQCIKEWHSGLSLATRREVGQNGSTLLDGAIAQAEDDFFKRVAVSMLRGNAHLEEWFRRFSYRQHPAVWKTSEGAGAAFTLANKADLAKGSIKIPDGLDIHRYTWAWGNSGPPQKWNVYREGGDLAFRKQNEVARDNNLGLSSPIATLTTSNHTVQWSLAPGGMTSGFPLKREHRFSLPESNQLILHTDHQIVTLQWAPMPDWCAEMGHDEKGIFAGLGEAERAPMVYWLNPGSYEISNAGTVVGSYERFAGCWMDKAQFEFWYHGRFEKPDWLDQIGIDRFGIFGDLRIGKVTQRFRWIDPGKFMMGSPEDEPERFGDETRHEVMLTRGYWLADTACTQELWQTVMGKNPSHHHGLKKPVESISWNDAVAFLERLNTQVGDLQVRLPTEAEWEYACRAGTTTRFSFGDIITTDQVNYNGNYPPEGSPKSGYRGGPVEVRSLPCNDWGLFEMHGNVWEWCADWYGAYPEGGVVDPIGAEASGSRVVRGGSWVNYGRNVRSADRYYWEPGNRYINGGFRLARG